MKNFKKYLKLLSFLVLTIIVLDSCSQYHNGYYRPRKGGHRSSCGCSAYGYIDVNKMSTSYFVYNQENINKPLTKNVLR